MSVTNFDDKYAVLKDALKELKEVKEMLSFNVSVHANNRAIQKIDFAIACIKAKIENSILDDIT